MTHEEVAKMMRERVGSSFDDESTFSGHEVEQIIASLSAPPAPARDEEIERLTASLEEFEWPVGEAQVVIYDPGRDLMPRREPYKIIDASLWFMGRAEIGERLYTKEQVEEILRSALQSERAGSGDAVRVAFNHGYTLACCNIVNLHDEPGVAFDTLLELGITKADVKAMDLTDYDMKALRKIERERGKSSVYKPTTVATALTVDADRQATGKEENRTPVSNVMGSGLVLECLKDARSKLTDSSKIDLAYIDEVITTAMQIGPPDTHLERIAAALKGLMSIVSDSVGVSGYEPGRVTTWDEFPEIEAARTVLPTMNLDEAHPDDIAVYRFAAAMKAKLAKKRDEGRGGWEDKDQCSQIFLTQLLRENVEKGDPINVGNFAMMLYQREERIASLLETLQGD